MKNKKKNTLLGVPSWRLSLYTAVLSIVILISIATLLGSILNIDENLSEGIAYIMYDIFIATACFLICRHNPKSVWYVPILCNIMGIIPAFVEANYMPKTN